MSNWREWRCIDDGHTDFVLDSTEKNLSAYVCTSRDRFGEGDGKMAAVVEGEHIGFFDDVAEAKIAAEVRALTVEGAS